MSLPTLDFKSENVSLRQGTHENLDFSQDFINKKYLYKITELNKDALSIEDFCENIEQDARRYSRCLNGGSKVVMI